jgi:hypothetical protein
MPVERSSLNLPKLLREVVSGFRDVNYPGVVAWPLAILIMAVSLPAGYALRPIERRHRAKYVALLRHASDLWDAGDIDAAVGMLRAVHAAGKKSIPFPFTVRRLGRFAGVGGFFLLEEALYECEAATRSWDRILELADGWLATTPNPTWIARKAWALVGLNREAEAIQLVRANADALRSQPDLATYCTNLLHGAPGAIAEVPPE